MNGTRISGLALLFAGIAFGSAHASNEPVFMMQLGSFPSEAEAQSHWSTIKGKYPNVLANMEAQVRSVTLPPDDLTVFRTQAGPLTSRGTAERLCAQITNAGDECFVVETAMVALPNVPMPSNSIAQAKEVMETIEAAPQQVAQAVSDTPAFLIERSAEAIPELPEDPASMALDAMPSIEPVPAEPVVEVRKPSRPRTLFGELFGDESEALFAEEREATPEPVAVQAPVAVQTASPISVPAPVITEGPEPIQVVLDEPVANALSSIVLPAPPRPEAITGGQTIEAPQPIMVKKNPPKQTEAPITVALPSVQSPAPATAAAVPSNSPFKPAQPRTTSAPVNLTEQAQGGQVAVAEAIPVPLTEQKQPKIQMQPQQTYSTKALAARGLPSQSLQQRTFWAQVSHFDSQQAALGFWESFRRNNPGFPAMRVRVTQPYAQSNLGNRNVSLRVGPFDGPGMVGALCKAMPSDSIRCGVVADLGTSTAANQSRGRLPDSRYGSRYAAASSQRPGVAGYWVQLGAYGTPGQAEFAWQELQAQVPALLGSLRADVNTPTLSSSSQRSFRLRTGPYVRVASATQLCGQLKQRRIRCLVVSGK